MINSFGYSLNCIPGHSFNDFFISFSGFLQVLISKVQLVLWVVDEVLNGVNDLAEACGCFEVGFFLVVRFIEYFGDESD